MTRPTTAKLDLTAQRLGAWRQRKASRSRATGGTGLGLGIARNIARSHGGDLVLRNRPEGGLVAVLTLPRRGAESL